MRHLETSVDVEAPPERVWAALADFVSYPDWNPFIRSIEGELRVGERLRVRIEPPGMKGMTLRPKLVAVDPPRRLCWLGRLWVTGLFDGEHAFEVEPLGSGRSRFVHSERFRGLLVPLVWRKIEGPTSRGFDAMNAVLKRRAEGTRATEQGENGV